MSMVPDITAGTGTEFEETLVCSGSGGLSQSEGQEEYCGNPRPNRTRPLSDKKVSRPRWPYSVCVGHLREPPALIPCRCPLRQKPKTAPRTFLRAYSSVNKRIPLLVPVAGLVFRVPVCRYGTQKFQWRAEPSKSSPTANSSTHAPSKKVRNSSSDRSRFTKIPIPLAKPVAIPQAAVAITRTAISGSAENPARGLSAR